MILEANNFLRKKGLFPENDSDDDEMVFGDDDFPSASDEVEEAPAAPAPEPVKRELNEEQRKKLKKVVKEGGKRGVEIEGAADMGGLQFFSTSVDEPEGDLDLLLECVDAMNAVPIPGEEERKGCSGHIGKMIFSVGVEQLAVTAYVPEAKQGELECKEWLQTVLNLFSGEVTTEGKTICQGIVKADGDKGVFPLKIREPMILESNNFLRKKGLFPENDSDDDEMVFGDDDFPSASDEVEEAPAAPAPEPVKRELNGEQKNKLKKVVKEGGKRGVEIEGAADMGGLQFFSTSVDEPEGDMEMLGESLNAMNAEAVEGEEERRGCSGHIGKTIFSAGPEQLAVVAYVPDDKLSALSCEE